METSKNKASVHYIPLQCTETTDFLLPIPDWISCIYLAQFPRLPYCVLIYLKLWSYPKGAGFNWIILVGVAGAMRGDVETNKITLVNTVSWLHRRRWRHPGALYLGPSSKVAGISWSVYWRCNCLKSGVWVKDYCKKIIALLLFFYKQLGYYYAFSACSKLWPYCILLIKITLCYHNQPIWMLAYTYTVFCLQFSERIIIV